MTLTASTLLQPSRSSFWLSIARFLWIVLAIGILAILIAGLPLRFQDLAVVCLEETCPPQTLNPVDAEALDQLGLSLLSYAWFQRFLNR